MSTISREGHTYPSLRCDEGEHRYSSTAVYDNSSAKCEFAGFNRGLAEGEMEFCKTIMRTPFLITNLLVNTFLVLVRCRLV